jgi:tetratricopeptide (TPR) repeat protein
MRADEHPEELEHSEELIDRARRGGLTREEQASLERHLAGCAVCAGQLALAPRFERELAPHPRDELLYQRAVEGALQRMRRSPPIRRVRRLPRWSLWAAAAALLVFGVTGLAAVIRQRMAVTSRPAPAVESRAAVAPPRPVARPVARPVERPVERAPAEAPVPLDSPPAKPAPSAHDRAHPAIIAVTAEALFEQGEQLRRARRADAAIAIYRRLQTTFPQTGEARLSFALAGQLLLERGRPGDALAQFDRHLSLNGEAGEEALAGRATALEQLQRTSEAAAAWRDLLARFPRSVYAERARARLDQTVERR